MDEKSNEQSVEVVNTSEKCKTFPSEESETTNKTKVTPEKESVRKPKDSSETLNLLGQEDREIDLLQNWANKGREHKKNNLTQKDFSVEDLESCLESEKN